LPYIVIMRTILAISLLITSSLAVDVTRNPTLDAKIKADATQLDKLADLPNDSDWLFDFTSQETYTYSPGSVVNVSFPS
jgi:hypothetical protein